MPHYKKRKPRPIKAGNAGEVYGKKAGTKKRKARSTEADNTGGKKKARSASSLVNNCSDGNGRVLDSSGVDKSTNICHAQIRATFYPKFENEKSDQEVRSRMIEVVSEGLATLEVSLKHSGSLFMYAGHKGGACAKNSFGNKYTAVGIFVLGRMFLEAWGVRATKKQASFNEFLEKNRMCISMELVTSVLEHHGQRPREDYVVVTAVTELGHGKPKFYSTPQIIAFCRKWRLPTNHVWLFSTRKSVTSFFAAFDALCEEGTASSVCQTLDQIADVSVPGSKDHIKVQGEILEGLVARIVSHESTEEIEQVLQNYHLSPADTAGIDIGPSLREICYANRSDEKNKIEELLCSTGTSFCPNDLDWSRTDSRNAGSSIVSKFLKAHPADFSTKKLQEMIRLMKRKNIPAAFKCFHNYQQMNSVAHDLHFKMIIHIPDDFTFRKYQREMKHKPELWPLYRGFFVDLNFSKADEEKAAGICKSSQDVKGFDNESDMLVKDGLADEDANLMIKLKFLPYKLRTFLIRNGLDILFKEGQSAYKKYYFRQMKIWKTSLAMQRKMSKMLDEWAVYICRKYGSKNMPSRAEYLNEAEPFLEKYAKRSPENLALIGCAGNLVRKIDISATVDEVREGGDLPEVVNTSKKVKDSVTKDQGLIVFFPGIPGCGKSALCKEILNAPGCLGDDRPVLSLMGDLVKGKYWQKIAGEHKREPRSIMLADKNAPNKEVWAQIAEMCKKTDVSAVPIIIDSEGTKTNPFSLEALAVFVSRVLQRANHPGKVDKSCPTAGFVLLIFYHLHEGKNRDKFEAELNECFGSLVKMPLLKAERSPLPDSVKSVLEDGISLYKLHRKKHRMQDSTKGTYIGEWKEWEKKLRITFSENAKYLNAIQVPFEYAVQQVLEQLKTIARGEYVAPVSKRKWPRNLAYAAVSLPLEGIHQLLHKLGQKDPKIKGFFEGKNVKTNSHVTLAHKHIHGVPAVARYGSLVNAEVPIYLNALLFTEKMAALQAELGSVNGEKVTPKNEWPHVTLWTKKGVQAKDANLLQQLFLDGKATRIEINPPVTITGVLKFF